MTLPPAVRRWWPQLKRVHRFLTLMSGTLFRTVAPVLGSRGVARTATGRSIDTVAREPGTVALHAGGPPVAVPRRPTPGDPAGHPVFEEERTAVVPATFTLEVTNGRLAGDFGATITPGGILDHETSTYFGVFDWREHPLYLRPTLGRIERVEGSVLSLAARGASGNYYHFLYDAIARYGVFEESMPGEQVDAVVVPHGTRYQRELLELAGIPGPYIQPQADRTVRADRLLVPSNPNWALQAPPSTVSWLRDRLPAKEPPTTPQRLYLTRGSAPQTRRYLEEEELMPELERRGFVRLDPGTLSVQQQIDTFHAAEVVVAPHGAGLTNVTFSPSGVRVLELFPSTYVHRGLWAICQAIGADYRYLVATRPARPGRHNAGISDDVSIPPDRVLRAVDELLG
ncbi:glycosyltransferase family 61 protein [Nocardioides bizhenqiangii]|uniref:Glycosyltransferase 61 family protein n=1 Tax=Nocardioides bizhenqiangii TaxID=3095076 RepID=A0ABZ0ZQS6_9ACTN|nr:glycosyltransferase 61 family protein [Nocardioides sp. HM61]WQQ25982.1 glycosyltransferase 61 family protein [Nocardioides sp. HM61]